MNKMPEIAGADHIQTLFNCGGYYACPKGKGDVRIGPLVGYAGKYDGPDGKKLQFVGDIYANFAKAEVYPNVLSYFACGLATRLDATIGLNNIDVLCGAPIGGYALATAIGLRTMIPTIKAEKKVLAPATQDSREKSMLFFGRHSVVPGLRYVIVEDVCNNFSTTEELINLIISAGGIVVGIACFLNRSLTIDGAYPSPVANTDIPIFCLVRLPINEYHQDDPEVVEDIKNHNVVWKPKDEWDRLMLAMNPD